MNVFKNCLEMLKHSMACALRSKRSEGMGSATELGLPGCKNRSWQRLEALPAEDVKDTAGAGDWCTAGIVHKLFREGANRLGAVSDAGLREAIRYGQALAASESRVQKGPGAECTALRKKSSSSMSNGFSEEPTVRLLHSPRSLNRFQMLVTASARRAKTIGPLDSSFVVAERVREARPGSSVARPSRALAGTPRLFS